MFEVTISYAEEWVIEFNVIWCDLNSFQGSFVTLAATVFLSFECVIRPRLSCSLWNPVLRADVFFLLFFFANALSDCSVSKILQLKI